MDNTQDNTDAMETVVTVYCLGNMNKKYYMYSVHFLKNIFHLWLVESTDKEPQDADGQLHEL